MELNDLVTSLMEQLQRVSRSESVVGKPHTFGESAVVPLCKVTVGFGTGSTDISGEVTKAGASVDVGGAGGGLVVEPKAFVVVAPGGNAQLMNISTGAKAIIRRAVDMLPRAVKQVLPEGQKDQG